MLDLDLQTLLIALDLPLPTAGDDKERLSAANFRNYQHFFKGKIKQCWAQVDPLPGVMLALEPGAGKTGTVLVALRELLDEGGIRRALIVAPLLVAKTTWPDEIDEWEETKGTTWTLIRAEDSDPDIAAVSQAAYAEALERWQAQFEAEIAAEPVLKKTQARAAVRHRWLERAKAAQTDEERRRKVKPKASPSELAEVERDAAVVAAKQEKLARLSREPTEIHIINKEALPWIWDNFYKGRAWPYDVIVVDDLREGRSGKKRTARGKGETTKGPAPLSRFGVLAAARKRVHATIELNGTPTPKGLENMWGLAYLIDQGARLGVAKKDFMDRWFNVDQYTHQVTPKGMEVDRKTREIIKVGWAFEEITGAVKDIMFSMDSKMLGELPPFVLDPIRVDLPTKVLEEYKSFERDMVSEAYDVEAVNGGVLHGKLLQFANGSMFREDGNDVWIHDGKIDALRELVERLDGTPLLVAYTYRFDVERICKAFPKAVVFGPENAGEVKHAWNSDKIPLLLAHRASTGHGLNLQKGTGHMCEYGLTSDAELFVQFAKRLRRPGRKTTVVNHVIMAKGTIDEDIYPMYLDPKIETQNRILQAIRVNFDQK